MRNALVEAKIGSKIQRRDFDLSALLQMQEHGSHDQSTHGNRFGRSEDGSIKILHIGGSSGTIKQSNALNALADKYRSDSLTHLDASKTVKIRKNDSARHLIQQKMDAIANDRLSVSAHIKLSVARGEHHAILPKLQKALDSAKRVRASNPDNMYQERIDALQQTMQDVQGIMGVKPKERDETIMKTYEVAASVAPPLFQPKPRIARIKSYFLEDGAISLNGRQYPKEAVDRLIQSAQLQLSDPNALPLTCYLSHDDADKDVTRAIAGKITAVGREGNKAYALIDIPNTQAGREAATLVAGGYIRSQSLRASGAEMRVDKECAFPLVGGSGLKLEGIDYTSSPGLPQVARISELIAESHEPQKLTEVFNAHPTTMLLEQETMMDLQEETLSTLASGVTQGVSDMGDPHDAYSQAQYQVPNVQMAGEADIDQEIHDHIAGAMNLECSPVTNVESRQRMAEAGKKFSANTKTRLLKAHDAVATKVGVQCASNGTGTMASNGMQDGDDDDAPSNESVAALLKSLRETMIPKPASAPIKERKMTPQEAAKLLAEAGYKIEAPKTKEQQLQEQLAAMQATYELKLAESQQKQMEDLKGLVAQFAPKTVQRKTLVEGAAAQSTQRSYYRSGDYLREKMQSIDPAELLDRSRPLPEGVDPERLLKEMYVPLLNMYDQIYHIQG